MRTILLHLIPASLYAALGLKFWHNCRTTDNAQARPCVSTAERITLLVAIVAHGAALQAARPDVLVVAAYGLILPQWVLDLPRLGCLNIHASILPRWRGAAPIHRAIEAGDAETGVTIMQMDAGLDTGDMLLIEKFAIGPRATTATLHDPLAALGGRLIVRALELAACGGPTPPSSATTACSTPRRRRRSRSASRWPTATPSSSAATSSRLAGSTSRPRWKILTAGTQAPIGASCAGSR